jgi:hypothetical protein
MMILALVPCIQCSDGDEASLSGNGFLSLQIPLAGDQCEVKSGMVSVDADDMEAPMETGLVIEGDALVGVLDDVPAGTGRNLVVQALNEDGEAVYEGTGEVTVIANEYVEAAITLYRNYENCPGEDPMGGIEIVATLSNDGGSGGGDGPDPDASDGADPTDPADPEPEPDPEPADGVARHGLCSAVAPCQDGLDCVLHGEDSTCEAPCQNTSECRLDERCWTAAESAQIGPALANHCFMNLCQPPGGGDPASVNIFQDAEWMGACNANGTGDGTCWGPVATSPIGDIGLCINTSGSAVPGGSCDPASVHGGVGASSCAGGMCPPSGPAAGLCVELCATDQADVCQDWESLGVETTCSVNATSPIVTTAGLCVPPQ